MKLFIAQVCRDHAYVIRETVESARRRYVPRSSRDHERRRRRALATLSITRDIRYIRKQHGIKRGCLSPLRDVRSDLHHDAVGHNRAKQTIKTDIP